MNSSRVDFNAKTVEVAYDRARIDPEKIIDGLTRNTNGRYKATIKKG